MQTNLDSLTINDFIIFLSDLTQSKTEYQNVPQISFSFKDLSINNLTVDLFKLAKTPSIIAEIVKENRVLIKKDISHQISSYFSIPKTKFKSEDSFYYIFSTNDNKFKSFFFDFLNNHFFLDKFLSHNPQDKIISILDLYFNSLQNLNENQNNHIEYNSLSNILDMCFQFDLENIKIPLTFISQFTNIKNPSHFYALMNLTVNNLTPEIEKILLDNLENSSYDNYQYFVASSLKKNISNDNLHRLNEIVTKNNIRFSQLDHIERTSLLLTNPSPSILINNNDISFTYHFNIQKDKALIEKITTLEKDKLFKQSFRRKIPVFINNEEYSMFAYFDFTNQTNNYLYVLIHDTPDLDIINRFKNFNHTIDNEVINNLHPKLSSFLTSLINNLFDLLVKKINDAQSLKMEKIHSKEYHIKKKRYDLSIDEKDYIQNKNFIRQQQLLKILDASSAEKTFRKKPKL